jgi:hypothetical protein
MLFNARPGLRKDVIIGQLGFLHLGAPGRLTEKQNGCAGAGLKECASVHGHSKQQRAVLLKAKVLPYRLTA